MVILMIICGVLAVALYCLTLMCKDKDKQIKQLKEQLREVQ